MIVTANDPNQSTQPTETESEGPGGELPISDHDRDRDTDHKDSRSSDRNCDRSGGNHGK